MKFVLSLVVPFAMLAAVFPIAAQTPGTGKTPTKDFKINWKKTVIDTKFRSEGVAVADVNNDGKKDILVGDVWYEAPGWKSKPIRKEKNYDGKNGYSETFAVFAEDLDKDGFVDQIVVGFPGKPCHWY